MAHIQNTWKVVPIDGGVGPKSFTFNPRGEEFYTGVSGSRIIK